MRTLLVTAAVAAAARCGGESDRDKARQDLVSWSGTLALAASQWGRGLDPTPYTRTVSDAARDAVAKTSKTLAEQIQRGDSSAAALQAWAQRLESRRQALDDAIAHRDGPRATAVAGELESLRLAVQAAP